MFEKMLNVEVKEVNDDDEIYIEATGEIFKDLRKCSKF